ncbi:MAG: hypothetical protein ACK5TU_18985 [Cyclobacteriaceae bacterium]|jgi:hypothetical protein
MRTVIKFIFIVVGSLAFMTFAPWGSTSPREIGFYLSIATVLTITFTNDFVVKKILSSFASKLENSIKLNLDTSETLRIESQANYEKGFERIGGKLFLTNRRVLFIPHKLNLTSKPVEFDLSKIEELGGASQEKLSFFYDGKEHKFVVTDSSLWLEKIAA